jgi:hypothetical protein
LIESDDRIKFAFNLFYHGVTGDRINSKFHREKFTNDDDSAFRKVLDTLDAASSRLIKGYFDNVGGPDSFDKVLNEITDIKFEYKPFIGHGSQLGHYFRHIYQMVKFIDQSPIINTSEKQNYLKTLRAQLSNHEQAILYINSLVNPGKKLWSDKNKETGKISRYIVDYKLIKNLPFHLVDFTIAPNVKFKEELKKAYPDKDDKWLSEATSEAFEELENLIAEY